MTNSTPLRVLSLGAGVQSSTLALMAAHGEIDMPDCAIFADTQAEPESVYRWLEWLEQQLPYPVHRVTQGNLAEEAMRLRISRTGTKYCKHSPPAWITENGEPPNLMMRQCTIDYKINPIRRKLRELGGKATGVIQLIGISLDEAQRMKPSRDAWVTNCWPLIERRMTRQHCLRWMADKGYPLPPRSSCWFCPYHSNQEWARLQKDEPADFERAVVWERGFQQLMTQVSGFRGTPYLHRSCVPLNQIDFNEPSPQFDMFGNECEGMCGV